MTDKFLKCIPIILELEGGYANNPADPGGETNFGISKRAHPELDIKNLTINQARQIYFTDYWIPAGCEVLDLPLALCHFDFAVNAGASRAADHLKEYYDFVNYSAKRLALYTTFKGWDKFAKGWTRRIMRVLTQARAWDKPVNKQWSIELDNSKEGEDVLIRVRPSKNTIYIRRDAL